jgi:hypothetical protein
LYNAIRSEKVEDSCTQQLCQSSVSWQTVVQKCSSDDASKIDKAAQECNISPKL